MKDVSRLEKHLKSKSESPDKSDISRKRVRSDKGTSPDKIMREISFGAAAQLKPSALKRKKTEHTSPEKVKEDV